MLILIYNLQFKISIINKLKTKSKAVQAPWNVAILVGNDTVRNGAIISLKV